MKAGIYGSLTLIVMAFVALGLAYARVTPAWQAPDEPAHFNYVRYLAEHGQLPILRQGDYPSGLPLAPADRPIDITGFNYESHQPPLFYAAAAAVYKLHPSLFAIRALSVLLGAALLPVVFWCARLVLPSEPWIWVGATGMVAFIPMHLFIAGSANNDTLADLVLSLLLLGYLAVAAGWRNRWRWVVLGFLLGLAMLTKLTIYPAAVLVVLAALVVAAQDGQQRGVVWPAGTTVLVAALVSGWWFVRNGFAYGWTDMLAQSRQAQVAGSQTHTGAFGPAQFGNWLVGSFYSFWGQFGWMSLPLPRRDYVLLLAFSGVVLVGLVWRFRGEGNRQQATGKSEAGIEKSGVRSQSPHSAQPGDSSLDAQNDKRRAAQAWLGLGVVWLGTTGSYLYYNLTFLQTQGRYLFPALVPVGVFCAAGVAALLPRRGHPQAMLGISLALLAFATYTLQHDLAPAFT